MLKPRPFRFTVHAEMPPRQALERVLDVRLHGRLVPFTEGTGPRPDRVEVGDRLVARTAWRRIGFDDVMDVVVYEPGTHLVLHKVGALLGGVVDVRCMPDGEHSRVMWSQTVEFPFVPGGLGRVAARVATPVLYLGYRSVVGRLLADSIHS